MPVDTRDPDIIKLEGQVSRANGEISKLKFQVGTLFNIVVAGCSYRSASKAMPMNGPPTYMCLHEKHYGKGCGIDYCPMGMILETKHV